MSHSSLLHSRVGVRRCRPGLLLTAALLTFTNGPQTTAALAQSDYPTVPHAGEYGQPGAERLATFLRGDWTTVLPGPVASTHRQISFMADGGFSGVDFILSQAYALQGTWTIQPMSDTRFVLVLYGQPEINVMFDVLGDRAMREVRSRQIWRREGR